MDDVISFNVGGAGKGTMLEAMLGGQFAIERDSHGHIFLDRDPKHFRRILNFLRTDKVVIPETREGQLEFLLEAQYYGVQEIEDSLLQALGTERTPSLILNGTGPALIFSNINWQPGPVTVEYWVRASSYRVSSIFWFRGFNNGLGSRFQMHAPWADGNYYFDYGGQSGHFADGPARVVASPVRDDPFGWHHVAATSYGSGDDRGMAIYIDGNRVAENYDSDAPDGTATTLEIGGDTQYLHAGALRDFRIWKCVKSEHEIRTSMNAKLTGKETDLWFFLPLNKPLSDSDRVVDLASGYSADLQPGTYSWSKVGENVFD